MRKADCRPLLILLAAALIATAWAGLPGFIRTEARHVYAVDKDVPFVPTPDVTVDEMLTMAKLGPDDTLIDLGSGDGRIVIAAAKRGARAIGIDIDPARIRESNENARAEGVQDKVKFVQQNIFDTDISPATVLTMYLLPSVNMKLRPKILSDLKPGSRVVSHAFDMGDWKPDRSEGLIYLWIVPVNVSGKWNFESGNGQRMSLDLRQKFQAVKGNLLVGSSQIPITTARVDGGTLRFTANVEGKSRQYAFIAKGDSLQGGTGSRIIDGAVDSALLKAKRVQGSKTEIDGGAF